MRLYRPVHWFLFFSCKYLPDKHFEVDLGFESFSIALINSDRPEILMEKKMSQRPMSIDLDSE